MEPYQFSKYDQLPAMSEGERQSLLERIVGSSKDLRKQYADDEFWQIIDNHVGYHHQAWGGLVSEQEIHGAIKHLF